MSSDLEVKFIKDFTLLQSRPAIQLTLKPVEAWALMSELQLALRHPLNKGGTAKIAMKIAQSLQEQLSITETLRKVAEMGWHAEFDRIGDHGKQEESN